MEDGGFLRVNGKQIGALLTLRHFDWDINLGLDPVIDQFDETNSRLA